MIKKICKMNIPTLMMKYNSILKKVYMLNLKVGQLSGLVNCPGWPIVRKCKGWSIVRGWPIVRVGQLSGCQSVHSLYTRWIFKIYQFISFEE